MDRIRGFFYLALTAQTHCHGPRCSAKGRKGGKEQQRQPAKVTLTLRDRASQDSKENDSKATLSQEQKSEPELSEVAKVSEAVPGLGGDAEGA
jgi:hypothetical protein